MRHENRCGGPPLKDRFEIERGETLHCHLSRTLGKIVNFVTYGDNQKPELVHIFDFVHAPDANVPEDRQWYAYPRYERSGETHIRFNGWIYRRVQPHQPPLQFEFQWRLFTKNKFDTVTYFQDYYFSCGAFPYFDSPNWKDAFDLDILLNWVDVRHSNYQQT